MKEPQTKINIGLVDDQSLFRKGIKSILSEFRDLEVVMEASNGAELLEVLNKGEQALDVLLLDLEMPVMNGVETLRALHSNEPTFKTIILSVHNEPAFVARMVELGAFGYLQKNADPTEVIQTIRFVHERGFYLNDEMMLAMRTGLTQKQTKFSLSQVESLTKREKEVLILICQQKSTAQIADLLFISQRTVEGHRVNLLQKTECRNSAGLAIFATQHQLFNPVLDE